MKVRTCIYVITLLLPWPLRRFVLRRILGFKLAAGSRIGFSLILAKNVELGADARIGHLNLCKAGVELLQIGEKGILGNLNWITAFPLGVGKHFAEETDREPVLRIGRHAAISHRNIIDCTNSIELGDFSSIGGFRSLLLTHSNDLVTPRQRSKPIRIGHHCFVGTSVVILGGARLPDCSVLGAASLLNKEFDEPYTLYGGVPAKAIKTLPKDYGFFVRTVGFTE